MVVVVDILDQCENGLYFKLYTEWDMNRYTAAVGTVVKTLSVPDVCHGITAVMCLVLQ